MDIWGRSFPAVSVAGISVSSLLISMQIILLDLVHDVTVIIHFCRCCLRHMRDGACVSVYDKEFATAG